MFGQGSQTSSRNAAWFQRSEQAIGSPSFEIIDHENEDVMESEGQQIRSNLSQPNPRSMGSEIQLNRPNQSH